jgi:putative aldouronate transport system substrate-binding protein
MKKITLFLISIMISVTVMTACGKDEKVAVSLEEIGYQYEDSSAPIVKEKGLIDFTILSSKNALADDYNDMKVFKDLYDSTNVDVKWNNIGEATYAAQKTLILTNKSQWPDAIYHAGFSDAEIIRYASRRSLVAISDYLDNMPNFKKILEERPDIKSSITNVEDGKIYALPRIEEMGLLKYPNLLFLNKNWVQSLINSSDITFLNSSDLADGLALTVEQYKQILQLFVSKDMNGNGKDDEIPLNFVYQNWQGNQSDLYAAFGLNENIDHRVIVDNKVVFTAVDDKFKTATQELASWVQSGYIDPVTFEQSQDNFLSNGKGTEKYGSFYWWESETVVSNPNNYICLSPLIGQNGQKVGVANNPEIAKGEFVVMSSCKNPEILLTYIDRFYNPYISAQINYGPIGIVYEEKLDEKEMLVQKEVPKGMTADELRLKNAPLGIIYLNDYAWENVVNMEPRAKLRLERLAAYAVPYKQENVKPFPSLSFNLSEVNALAGVEQNVYDYVYSNQTKWLLGQQNLNDSVWNEYKSTLYNTIGLQKLIDTYQSAYDRYLSQQK